MTDIRLDVTFSEVRKRGFSRDERFPLQLVLLIKEGFSGTNGFSPSIDGCIRLRVFRDERFPPFFRRKNQHRRSNQGFPGRTAFPSIFNEDDSTDKVGVAVGVTKSSLNTNRNVFGLATIGFFGTNDFSFFWQFSYLFR